MNDASDPRAAFLEAAVWHGTLERAEAVLAAHPEIAGSDIYMAAILGDAAAVQRLLALDAYRGFVMLALQRLKSS